MTTRGIFFEEWRRCLIEHYKYVVRNGDTLTERSLTRVLLRSDVGFTEDELRQFYLEATMHVDHLPDGFVPGGPTFEAMPAPHPAECQCAACAPELEAMIEAGHDEEGQPLSLAQLEEKQAEMEEREPEQDEAEPVSQSGQDKDAPRQISMF